MRTPYLTQLFIQSMNKFSRWFSASFSEHSLLAWDDQCMAWNQPHPQELLSQPHPQEHLSQLCPQELPSQPWASPAQAARDRRTSRTTPAYALVNCFFSVIPPHCAIWYFGHTGVLPSQLTQHPLGLHQCSEYWLWEEGLREGHKECMGDVWRLWGRVVL